MNFDVRKLKGKPSIPDETIEAIRQASGTQREVAERFGVSQSTVRDVRKGCGRFQQKG